MWCSTNEWSNRSYLCYESKIRCGGATSSREALYSTKQIHRFGGDSAGTHDSDNASGFNGIDSDGVRLTALGAGWYDYRRLLKH